MTNNGILNNSGAFEITTGNCTTSISITNSEMLSGSINLANTSTTLGIKIDNAKMTSPTISIATATTTGLSMSNNGILINLTSFAITGTCATGISINNSEMASDAITLANPSTTGLLMTNNGILNNSGLFQITTGNCDTSISITNSEMLSDPINLLNTSTTVGIKINNSKITSPRIGIANATIGLSMINNSILINLTSFVITGNNNTGIEINNSFATFNSILIPNPATGLKLLNNSILINTTSFQITGNFFAGIEMDKSKMISNSITLNNPSVRGLSMTNNSILNISGAFQINTGNCSDPIIGINNSKMSFGSINLSNTSDQESLLIQNNSEIISDGNTSVTSSAIGIKLINSKFKCADFLITDSVSNTGLLMYDNSFARINSISIPKSSIIGISMSNKSYLEVSTSILLFKVGEKAADTNTEYGILLRSNSTLHVSGTVQIVGLNTDANTSKNTNGLLIDDSYFCTKEALFVIKNVFNVNTYNSLGTGIIIQNNGILLASKCVIENWGYSVNMSNSLMKIDTTDYSPAVGTSINSLVKNNNPLIILNNSKLYSIGKAGLISVVSKSDGATSNANTNCVINVYNKSYLYLKYFTIGDATPAWVTRTGIYINDSDVKIANSFTLVPSRVGYSIVAKNNSKLLMDTNISNFTEPIYIGAQLSKTLGQIKAAVSINDYTLTGTENVCATIYNPSEETAFALAQP